MVVVLRFLQLSRSVATLPERPNSVLGELLSLPEQSHQFVYLGNNPINFTDPLGLQAAELVTKTLEAIDVLCSFLESINCGKDAITACKAVVLGVGIPVTLVGLTVATVGGIGLVTGAAVGITVAEAVTFGTLGVSAGVVTFSAAESIGLF